MIDAEAERMRVAEADTEPVEVPVRSDPEALGERYKALVEAEELKTKAEELPAFPQPDPTTERCPVCLGYGEVATGSLVEAYALRTCPPCGGQGFVSRPVPLDQTTQLVEQTYRGY